MTQMETLFTNFLQDKDLKSFDFDVFIKRNPKQLFPVFKQLRLYRHVNHKLYQIDDELLDKYFKRYNELTVMLLIFIHPYVTFKESIVYDYLKSIVSNNYASEYKKELCFKYVIYCLDTDELLDPAHLSYKYIKSLCLTHKAPSVEFPWSSPTFALSNEHPLESIANIKLHHANLPPKTIAKYVLDLFFNATPTTQFLIKRVLPTIMNHSVWNALLDHVTLYMGAGISQTLLKYILIFLLQSASTMSTFVSQLQAMWPLLHAKFDSWTIINRVDQCYCKDYYENKSSTRQLLLQLVPLVECNATCYLILLTDHFFNTTIQNTVDVDESKLHEVLLAASNKCQNWLTSAKSISTEDVVVFNHTDYYPVKDVLNIHAIKDAQDRKLRFKQVNQQLVKLTPKENQLLQQQIKIEQDIKAHVQDTINSCPVNTFEVFFESLFTFKTVFSKLTVESLQLPCIRHLFDDYVHCSLLNPIFNISMDPLLSYCKFLGFNLYATNNLLIQFMQHPFDDPSDLFLQITQFTDMTNCVPVIASFIQSLIVNNKLKMPVVKYLSNHTELSMYFNNIPTLLPLLFGTILPNKVILIQLIEEILEATDENKFDILLSLLKLYDTEDADQRVLVVESIALLKLIYKHPFIDAFNELVNPTLNTVDDAFVLIYKDSVHPFIWHSMGRYCANKSKPFDFLKSLQNEYSILTTTKVYRESIYPKKAFLLTKIYHLLRKYPDYILQVLQSVIDKNEINDEEMNILYYEYFNELIDLNKSLYTSVLPYLLTVLQNNEHLLIIQWIGCFSSYLTTEQCNPIFEQIVQRILSINNEDDQIQSSRVLLHFWTKIEPKLINKYISINESEIVQFDELNIRGKALLLATYAKSKGIKHYHLLKHDSIITEYSLKTEKLKLFALKMLDYHSLLFNRVYEPYFINHIMICLEGFGSSIIIRKATNKLMKRIMSHLSYISLKLMIPKCLLLINHEQWRIRNGCCLILGFCAYLDAKVISDQLPFIIPVLTNISNDSHYQVSASAKEALGEFSASIHNPELQGHSKIILKALADEKYLDEALTDLLSTTFTHSVDTSSFALLLPLLNKGLHVNKKKDSQIRSAQLIGSLVNICTWDTINTWFTELLPKLKGLTGMALPEIRAYSCKAYGSIISKLPNKLEYLTASLEELKTTKDVPGISQLTSELFYANGPQSLIDLFPMIKSNCNDYPLQFTTLLTYLPMAFQHLYNPFIPNTLDCLVQGLNSNDSEIVAIAVKGANVLIQHYSNTSVQLLLPPLISLFLGPIKLQAFQLLQELIITITDININSKNNQSHVYDELQFQFKDHFVVILSHVYIGRFDVFLDVRSLCTQLWKLIIVNTHSVLTQCTPSMLTILPELSDDQQITNIIRDVDTKYKQFYTLAMAYYIKSNNTRLVGILVQQYPHVPLSFVIDNLSNNTNDIIMILTAMPELIEELIKVENVPWNLLLSHLSDYYEFVIEHNPKLLMTINDAVLVNEHLEYIFNLLLKETKTPNDDELALLFKHIDEDAAVLLIALINHELHHHRSVLLACLLLQIMCKLQQEVVYNNYWSIFNNLIINDSSDALLNTLNDIIMTIPKTDVLDYCLKVSGYVVHNKNKFNTRNSAFVGHLLLPNYTSIYRVECIEAVYMISQDVTVPMTWIGPLIRVLPNCDLIGFKCMLYYLKNENVKPFLPQLHRVIIKCLENEELVEFEDLYEMTGIFMTKHSRVELFVKEILEKECLGDLIRYPIDISEALSMEIIGKLGKSKNIGNVVHNIKNSKLKEEVMRKMG